MTTPSVVPVEARSYELDPYGHVNNAVYASWLEHGRLCYLRDRGETYTSIPERYGVHVVVVNQNLSYSAQVRLGDELDVVSRIDRFGRTSFTFDHLIRFRDTELVACSGRVVMVCVGSDEVAVAMPAPLRAVLDT